MRLTDVGTLDPEARASMRGEIRRQLAHFRGNATQRQRAAARRLVASGGLADARMEGGGATAAVQDEEGAFEVRVDLTDPAAARCGCAAFRRRASCAHVVGLLEAALASLEAPAAPSSGGAGAATNAPTWLQRLEGITASIESAGAPQIDPWQAAAAQAADAPDVTRHVLRFAERRGVVEARLERQVRRGPAGQKGERWVNVPFAGEDAPRALGPAHDRVTAIACGASDAGWMNDPTLRSVAVAVVRREIAAPLLEAAASAGPLVLGEDADAEPLELDLERPVALELEAEDESAARWRVHGWLRIGRDDRVPASSIVRAARDGVCALRNPARVVLLPEGDTSLVATDLARAPLEVPREEAPTLCALAGAATFVGDELAEVAAPAPPTPCLRADSPLDIEGNVRVWCEVEFDYGGTRVRVEDRTRVIPSLDGRSVPRRPRIEAEALARFRELGGRPSPAMPSASMKGGHGNATVPASSFLGMVAALVDEGWNVVAKDCLVRRATSLEASVSSGVDWFELEGGVRFGDEVIPFPEALLAARDARGFVRLGDGSTGLLPQRWLERWQLATLGDPEGDALRFSNSQSWVLTALADLRKEEAGDPLAPLRDRFAALTAPAPTDPPAEFTGTLRPYQREGLGWLLGLDAAGLSGCLADDMGLGKTVQVLAYLVTRASAGANDGRHSLVVAPRSLVFNWLAEAGRFAPSIQVVDFTGPGRWMRFQATPPGSLLVTTYGALRNDAERLAETELDVVVLDESQAIKSRRSQTACAARALR
ncbi:MAG: SNF2-related protein, partial [Planctomycetota bacterium]